MKATIPQIWTYTSEYIGDKNVAPPGCATCRCDAGFAEVILANQLCKWREST